jgi:Tfp pilus assembly protein PilN
MTLREVNLIPTEILARRRSLKHLWFWAGCLLISLSLICGFYLYKTHYILAKKRALTTLKDTHKNLDARIEEIKRIQEELEKVSQQQSVLETIVRDRPYSIVLLKLAEIMNEYTWLKQLTIDSGKDEKGDANLKLTGFSFSNEELGNFLNQLTSEPMFKAVILKYANETEMAQSNRNTGESVRLIEFQIECSI